MGDRSTRRRKTLISPTIELDSPERALIDHDSSKSYKLKSKIVYKKFYFSYNFFLRVTLTREQTYCSADFPTINYYHNFNPFQLNPHLHSLNKIKLNNSNHIKIKMGFWGFGVLG